MIIDQTPFCASTARAGSSDGACHFNAHWDNYERINNWFRSGFTLVDLLKQPELMDLEDEFTILTSHEKDAIEDAT